MLARTTASRMQANSVRPVSIMQYWIDFKMNSSPCRLKDNQSCYKNLGRNLPLALSGTALSKTD